MCTLHLQAGGAAVAYADDAGRPADAPDPALVEDLVCANRILFDQGIVDAFGHVSVRHDKDPQRFLLARNMAPGTVDVQDIVEFTLDGVPVNAGGRAVYLERFIHGEIYKARPDVQAIVHSHSPTVLPFSVTKRTPLRPVCHMSGFLGAGTPVFEIRETAGDATDLLVRDNALGAALARRLGSAAFVLMRGHGSTVVAPTLKQAVYRAVYAEVNARMQIEALQLGDVVYLSEQEAATACANIETQVERPWALWKQRVQREQHVGAR
ncbi:MULTISPECIES: class II aldolase/adducin family protein [Burkholderia]|nr:MULTISPECIES: class II aldolase/adducin family protein [Burkholderia]EMD9440827.1 class II aldolase/adducin family protein [Burkholderia cepacia]ERJ38010.1 Ribulose-5-phosphate 4-epimerase [Burkholderia sp. AU4i]KVE88929.1 aldolase [Burkholderia cepacia]KWF95703.1 aldolase [Burkholderia cepacia]KWH24715.1 aldolase [Burkholderia cepacia]